MDDIVQYLLTPATQIALIIALAQLFKEVGFPTKYIPLLDLGLGILSGVVIFGIFMGQGIIVGVLLGIAEGLSACGLFSGIKNFKEG